jgi:hypoxanthine phosphoribosyltransferase
MHLAIDRILIHRDEIARRVTELAAQITADHIPPHVQNGAITIVPVMTGAMIFCADLIRRIPIPMKIGLAMVSSYPGKSMQSLGPQVVAQHIGDIRDRHVLVVDDVLDSGQTIGRVVPTLKEMGAIGVKTCVLLRKNRPSAHTVKADYLGFEIPDEFIVGYGLDYDDFYRNVPDIVTLKKSAFIPKA